MTYQDILNYYKGWRLVDIAAELEVSRVSLLNWKLGIPRDRQLAIQALTKGKLKADKKIKK